MASSSIRKHASTGPASDQPAVPEPAFAERARTLMYLGRIGSLSTLSRKQPGFPFGSVMPYGLDQLGRPIFLISTMAMHTQNLKAEARASLLITQLRGEADPLGDAMGGIIEHMNADHKDSLVQLARRFAGIEAEQAEMTSVDRLGFQVRLKTAEGVRGARIGFPREVSSPAEVRSVLVEMVQTARQPAAEG